MDLLKVSPSKHAEIITGVTPVRLTTPSLHQPVSQARGLHAGSRQMPSYFLVVFLNPSGNAQMSVVESVYTIMSGWLTEEAQLILPCSPNAYHQKVQMIFNRLSGSTPNVFRSIRRTSYPFIQAPTIWGYFPLY